METPWARYRGRCSTAILAENADARGMTFPEETAMNSNVRKIAAHLNSVRAALRACPKCDGAGFVEWLSGSGCHVNGARCTCPIGRFDSCLSAARVAVRNPRRLAPAW